MIDPPGGAEIRDNGGRRSGIDPRQFSYSGHIPERRSGLDRRKIIANGKNTNRRKGISPKKGLERRSAFL